MTDLASALPEDGQEAAAARYLAAHPEFFERHLELLDTLRVPHPVRGAVSLLERQLERLREQNGQHRQRLAQLVEVARSNERLAARMQALALGLLEARGLDERTAAIVGLMRDEFGADASGLKLVARPREQSRSVGVFVAAAAFERYHRHLAGKPPQCGVITDEWARDLFDLPEIGSAALLPLRGAGWEGLLAIGSHDERRFGPGLGTLFLGRIAELVTGALDPYLGAP